MLTYRFNPVTYLGIPILPLLSPQPPSSLLVSSFFLAVVLFILFGFFSFFQVSVSNLPQLFLSFLQTLSISIEPSLFSLFFCFVFSGDSLARSLVRVLLPFIYIYEPYLLVSLLPLPTGGNKCEFIRLC